MKNWILLTFTVLMPLTMTAQDDDDMYFVPNKQKIAEESRALQQERLQREVQQRMPRYSDAGDDVIDFSAVRGVYPDSTYQELSESDYQYTKRLNRFDDYRCSYYPWYDTYYDPWYYAWYDPWYAGWYYGPYWRYRGWTVGYWGWYGYSRPWYHYSWYRPRPVYRPYRTYGGSRRGINTRPTHRSYSIGGRSYGGHRSSSWGSGSSGGSFGGTRSGGSFGGSRSSGGSFGGGGNRGGGGRSFGGRK